MYANSHELHEALERTRLGTPALVVIRGPSGIGKSALLNHFLDHVRHSAGGVVLAGRCHAQEQLPFKAFDTLIDALGRYLIGVSAVEAASLMPREVNLLARLFPTLYRVPAVLQMPAIRDADWDDAMLRARAFSALKELLARIADRSTLALGFDDLQWTDQDSTDLLRELMRSPGAPACLFVCAMRDSGGDASWLTAPGAVSVSPVELALEPLDPAASAELARAMLGDSGTEQDVQTLVSEATGSPFLLEQLSRDARGRGGSRGLRAAMEARVAKLDAGAKALLELVCSAGHPLELAIAIDAARAEPRCVPALLAWSLVRTSVRHGTEYLETHHDRIGEVVAEAIEPSRRRELHQRLAETLVQKQYPDSDLIASHFRAAGLPRIAALHTLHAAEQAKRVFAFGRAAELYEVAIAEADASRRPGLELALAEAYANVGRLTEAAELYEKLARLPELHRERRELTQQAMVLHLLVGSVEPGARLLGALCQELGMRPLSRSRWLSLLMILLLVLRYRLGPRIAALPVPKESRHRGTSRERLDLCVRATRGFVSLVDRSSELLFAALRAPGSALPRPCPMAAGGGLGHHLALCSARLELGARRSPHERRARAGRSRRRRRAARAGAGDRGHPRDVHRALHGRRPGDGARRAGAHGPRALDGHALQRNARCASRRMDLRRALRRGRGSLRCLAGRRTRPRRSRQRADRAALRLDGTLGNRRRLRRSRCAFRAGDAFRARKFFQRLSGLLGRDRPLRRRRCGRDRRLPKATQSRFFAPLRHFPYTRCWSSLLLARAYLLWAREDSRRRAHWWRLAAREARRLTRLRFRPAEGAAALIRGVLAAQQGDHESAVLRFEHAAQAFDRDGVLLHAAAARDRLGRLRQGVEGAALIDEAAWPPRRSACGTHKAGFGHSCPAFGLSARMRSSLVGLTVTSGHALARGAQKAKPRKPDAESFS